MGRKKLYDREELLEKALHVFGMHGYKGTSTQMLVEELGVNKFSLYSEFTNKQTLFNLVLEKFNKKIIETRFGPMLEDESDIHTIIELLTFYGKAVHGPASGKGCLFCNTAIEFGPEDPTGEAFIAKYFTYLRTSFSTALLHASVKGQIVEKDIEETADFLTSLTLGIFVMIRAKAPNHMVENASKMAIEYVEGLRIVS